MSPHTAHSSEAAFAAAAASGDDCCPDDVEFEDWFNEDVDLCNGGGGPKGARNFDKSDGFMFLLQEKKRFPVNNRVLTNNIPQINQITLLILQELTYGTGDGHLF